VSCWVDTRTVEHGCRRCVNRSQAAGIGIADVKTILLTHIHLDQAGATGTLVRENPRLRVYVHEVGAPHLIDPSRLVASASRLVCGCDLERLWGRSGAVCLADRSRCCRAVSDSGRRPDVRRGLLRRDQHRTYVSYFSAETGVAFVGDTAGVRLVPGAFVMPRRRRRISISRAGATVCRSLKRGAPTRC